MGLKKKQKWVNIILYFSTSKGVWSEVVYLGISIGIGMNLKGPKFVCFDGMAMIV